MNKILEKYQEKAVQMDNQDPLKDFRTLFALPENVIYLCNNSLGLPAKDTFVNMQEQLQRWAELGVDGWFKGKPNWYRGFEDYFKKPLSQLLGANEDEVVVMNSLTVNLHLLLTSFFRPTKQRFKILIESPTFPSDLYAIKSHLQLHGLNSSEALIILEPRSNEHLIRNEDIERALLTEGDSIALVFFSGVNFLTGQVFDMKRITQLAKERGCLVGFDLAHAIGNIPLELHQWGIDFAVGCSYKYLCSGPGGPGIAFVHRSHDKDTLPRLSGWWGNDPETRFKMHLQDEFTPFGVASSWQVSTPSILSMVPLAASLKVFEEAEIDRIREKSRLQTAFLMELLNLFPADLFEVITPVNPDLRGGQLSLLIHSHAEECLRKLEERGMICDFRPPNIIRVTPSPLYNTFHEVYLFAGSLWDCLKN